MDSFLRAGSCAQPQSLGDKVHELIGNPKGSQNIQSLTRPHLDRLQMSWEADVEDVYPIIGTLSFLYMKDFPNPHKRVYITSLTDPYELVAALKASLRSWSSLRSIAVEYDQATHLMVVLRATQQYFNYAILFHPDVEDEQALTEISIPGNHTASELPQGLLFKMVVAKVKSTKTIGLVTLVNHAVCDGVSIIAWAKDVEAMLIGTSVVKRVHHKAFAEAYYLHQTSLAAQLVTNHHAKRLRGIRSMQDALWPPAHRLDSIHTRAGVPNQNGKTEAIEGGGYSNAQILRYRRCPKLATTGRKASTLVSAAIAIFNTSMTGSKHVVFGLLLAGREWPLMSDSLARLMPDPMSIAGPTSTTTVALMTVDDAEQISHFLGHVETELGFMKRHQHVPLDFAAHLDEADREVWYLAQSRQVLNYQPNDIGPKSSSRNSSSAKDDSPFRLVLDRDYKVDQPVNTFVWECGLEGDDAETVRIRALFNPDVFSEDQVLEFTEKVFDVVEFLSEERNGAKAVGEMRAIMIPLRNNNNPP